MAELLNAEQMLRQLNEHGQDAGSDYNDSDEVDGYFGWEVEGDVLVVTHEISEDSDRRNPEVTRRWRLVPIEAS